MKTKKLFTISLIAVLFLPVFSIASGFVLDHYSTDQDKMITELEQIYKQNSEVYKHSLEILAEAEKGAKESREALCHIRKSLASYKEFKGIELEKKAPNCDFQ